MGAINKIRDASNQHKNNEYNEQRPRNKRNKFMRRAGFLLIVGLIVSSLMYSNVRHQQVEVQKIREQKVELQKQHDNLLKEKRFLEKEIAQLNDDEYILKIARRDFFFSKEGEIIFPVDSQQ